MKKIKLSVQEFASPAPKRGSLESGGGFNPGMQKGIELHQIVQRKRRARNPEYQAEKKLSRIFERGGFEFIVEGRMDGFIPGLVPKIEEIKTTFNLNDLYLSLKADPYNHPYGLQLLTYGHIYWLEHKSLPELTFHLISTRDNKSIDFELPFDLQRYEEWLELRLLELVEEAEHAGKRLARRKKLSHKLLFPFPEPRSGQMELVKCLEETLKKGKNLLLQAPTGLGKTIGVLYPSLKESLARGQRVIYVTAKNSQQQVAEEALEKIWEQGCKVKSMTLTARRKICMKDEVLCDPQYCEYARSYYDKLSNCKIVEQLRKKRSLSARTFRKMAEEFEVCPFELQMEAVQDSDAVIGDYNHVFSNRSSIGKLSVFDHAQSGKPNLIIDEAHNLPQRTMSQFSPSLSCAELDVVKQQLDSQGKALITSCQALIREQSGAKRVIKLEAGRFTSLNEDLREYLGKSYDVDPALLALSFSWAEFTGILEFMENENRSEFFAGFYPDPDGGRIKITCCDASELVKPMYNDYQHVVAFSATIKPFDFYAGLSGLSGEKLEVAEFYSPYPRDHRKIMLIPQVSTKFLERDRNYSKVAETISRVSGVKEGNYLAFFPSFDFMEKTLPLIQLPSGFKLLHQKRKMKRDEVEGVLSELKSGEGSVVLCGVQGGMFSEGIDYPGKMVIGAFIVGPPLPNFDFERERMKDYYQSSYEQGFEFAYTFPAMAKAIQAAGRVIRSESDHGIIVLMDNRFLSEDYFKTMPQDWFINSPQELVSKGILDDIREFWSTTPY